MCGEILRQTWHGNVIFKANECSKQEKYTHTPKWINKGENLNKGSISITQSKYTLMRCNNNLINPNKSGRSQ